MAMSQSDQTPQQRLAAYEAAAARIREEIAAEQARQQDAEARTKRVLADAWQAEANRCAKLFDSALEELATALRQKADAGPRVQAAKAALEEAESAVLLNGTVDGKNAELRKAQLTLALRDDPAYQRAKADLADAERALDEANAAILLSERRLDAAKVQLRIVAATLEMLA